MKISKAEDQIKVELGRKWSKLFRPFPENEYPNELSSVPPGWVPLLDRMCAELNDLLPFGHKPSFDRIQAKNGHLEAWWAFITDPGTPVSLEMKSQIEHLITRYENESFLICGWCGNPAKEGSGEHLPICDTCLTNKVAEHRIFQNADRSF